MDSRLKHSGMTKWSKNIFFNNLMIILHRLNGQAVTINAELIESVESMPDTKVVLISNNQYLVKESPTEIVEKVVEYKRKITGNPPVPPL